jgi:hypothetical protein
MKFPVSIRTEDPATPFDTPAGPNRPSAVPFVVGVAAVFVSLVALSLFHFRGLTLLFAPIGIGVLAKVLTRMYIDSKKV